MIFKKGDVADRVDYRPIPLLQIGCKLFAPVLFQRLINGGADGRIWSTQFGTLEAVFLTRRIVGERIAGQMAGAPGAGLGQSV